MTKQVKFLKVYFWAAKKSWCRYLGKYASLVLGEEDAVVAVEAVVEVEEVVEEVTATIAMAVVSQVVSFYPPISIIKEYKYVCFGC